MPASHQLSLALCKWGLAIQIFMSNRKWSGVTYLHLVNLVQCMYRSVPQICPPFATLALVQNVGGAYTWDATISLAITPSLHDLIVGGGGGQVWGREMLPTLAVGWRVLALRGEEAGHFREVAGASIVDAGGPCLWYGYFNGRQPSGLNNISTAGWVFFCRGGRAYVRNKIPQKDCAKNAGGEYLRTPRF